MSTKVVERGNLIKKPMKKQGYCGTCDDTPTGRVSAEELWVRNQQRDRGFVRITPT